MPARIEETALPEETRRRYLSYAFSVITSRALPDVRDGLKPVQRRILHTMGTDLRLSPDARFVKSARVVGDVMGKYHPHGDQAIYDAMVRMAQDFSLRYPLVQGYGNFGSLDGDPQAAMRYTEARLHAIAMEALHDLKEDTVAFRPTYDESRTEPAVLPMRIPNLLVNGTTGIAVGMATSIPPHNLGEVLDACVRLIDEPAATLEDLLRLVQGPDLPTGGEVLADAEALREIYETGRGTLRMRGTWAVEKRGRRAVLLIGSIPYGVEKAGLVSRIGELIGSRKVPQALDVRDESTDEVCIAVELRSTEDADAVAAYLYRHTPLMETLSFNLTCLVPVAGAAPAAEGGEEPAPGEELVRPERLGLLTILRHFLAFRLQVVTRRLRFQLRKLEERIHILEGFEAIFGDLDEAIALIRRADGRDDARKGLVWRFSIDEVQADAVLDTRLYRLAKLEIDAIRKELGAKRREAKRLQGLLKSEEKRWTLVREELLEMRARYADPRRTKVVKPDAEELSYDEEEFIIAEDTHVVLTRGGWLKRVGRLKSATATRTRDGDEVGWVLVGSTRQNVVFFSNLGSAYVMRIHDVPATSGYGEPIQKHFKFADGEQVVGALSLDARMLPGPLVAEGEAEEAEPAEDAEPGGLHVFCVTKRGNVLRAPLASHAEVSQRGGRRFCRLVDERDRVLRVELCTPEKEAVLIATRESRAIHFALSEVKVLAGVGKGVRGIKLDKGDEVVAAALTSGRGDGLKVETSRGAVRELTTSGVAQTARGGKGRELMKREQLVGPVPEEVSVPVLDAGEDGELEDEVAEEGTGEGADAS